jgi:hypothetical protein
MKDPIEKALRLLASAPYEINVDGNKGTLYPTLERAVAAAKKAEADPKTRSVYFVFNPIDADRRAAYIKAEKAKDPRKSPRTCGEHIVKRVWVVLDFDPVRSKGANATDAEKQKALEVVQAVIEFLAAKGFLEPIRVDSGNGFHLYYRADLPNDERSKQAVKRFTDFLSLRFTTDEVIVDRMVHKAAQLMRLPGTTNRKSPATADRPQREAILLAVPKDGAPITPESLDRIAPPPAAKPKAESDEKAVNVLDVFAYGDDVGLEFIECDPIDRLSPEGPGYTVYPVVCPFDPSHKRGESYITLGTNGAIGFHCWHHSCADKNWESIKDLLGPPTYEHYPQPTAQDDFGPIEADELDGSIFDAPKRQGPQISDIRDALASRDKPSKKAIVDKVLRVGDVMVMVSHAKGKKTWLNIDLALSVASGGPWLGFDTNKARVLVVDNEMKKIDYEKRVCDVLAARSLSRDSVGGAFNYECLRDGGRVRNLLEMSSYFEAIKGRFDLIILDAFYRFLPPKVSENDNGDMTRLMNIVSEYAVGAGAAIVLVHHTSKGGQGEKATTDVGSGAGAISRAADCHFTFREHELENYAVVSAVARCFPPTEPFSIKWDFPVWNKSDEVPVLAIPKSRGESKLDRRDSVGLESIVAALDERPRITAFDLRKVTGFGPDRVNRLIAKGKSQGLFNVESEPTRNKGGSQFVVCAIEGEDPF